jgi:hypothetical protein
MTHPLFFLSYARGNYETATQARLNAKDDSNSVERFYDALSAEVAELTGSDAREVGFFDRRSLDLATLWPSELISGLLTTRVMVALFSPAYFSRPACGREFEIFRRRHAAACKRPERPKFHLIIPVLWVRPDVTYASIPACRKDEIAEIQNLAPGMPDCYATLGLARMFKLSKTTEINDVCCRIADRIYSIINDETVKDFAALDGTNFNDIPSAFHEPPTTQQAARLIDPKRREIRIFYLAPTKTEWRTETGKLDEGLGMTPYETRPFHDAPGATLRSATEEGVSEVLRTILIAHEEIQKDFATTLGKTKDTQTTPLVVFDRRAIRIPVLRRALDSYIGHNFANTGFATACGNEIPDEEVESACKTKNGALPKLHNWNLPSGRTDYVRNVALIVHELDSQLVIGGMEHMEQSSDSIPGLRGPSAQ